MTLPLILFTAVLAGLSTASLFWFGADLVQKLRHTMAQRARAKKLAAEAAALAAPKEEGGKGRSKK